MELFLIVNRRERRVESVPVAQRRTVEREVGRLLAVRDEELSYAAAWGWRLGGGERDQLVQESGKHRRTLVDSQHVGTAAVHNVQALAPETLLQRPSVTSAAETGRSEERLRTE